MGPRFRKYEIEPGRRLGSNRLRTYQLATKTPPIIQVFWYFLLVWTD